MANQTTEEEVPVEMFMQLMQQAGGQEGGGQGPMMAARGGRVHADNGGSMEVASSPSGSDMSGWHEMFLDLQGNGEIPDGWDFNDFMENLDALDISPTDFSARGGYKTGRVHAKGGRYLTPDDYDDDDIRYDEDLIDIFEDDSAMFHGDYDVADEWKEGGIATVPRQKMFLGGLGVALAKLGRKGKASDFAEFTEKETVKDTGSDFEEFTEKETIKDDRPSPAAPLWMMKDWVNKQKEKEEGFQYDIDIDGDKYDFSFDEKLTEGGMDEFREKFGITEDEKETGAKGKFRGISEDILKSLLLGPLGSLFNRKHPKILELMGEEYKFEPGPASTLPLYAEGGGIGDLDLRGGGASFGPGTGTSDDIPAMLSDGEFVVTANAVKNLGGGDRMEGAKKMYSMMNQLDPNSQAPSEISGIGYA